MTSKNTILLTGATGFLGSHLCTYLLKNTSYNLLLLKRSFSNTARLQGVLSSARVKTFDVDTHPLTELDWSDVQCVVHCATEYGRKGTSCHQILASNLMFPVQLVEESIAHGVESFINTDSYFNKEHFSYSHLLHYSLSKKSLGLWLNYFSSQIKVINLVLEHIFGPDDNPDKFVEQMIRQIAVTPQAEVNLSAGTQKRDFIYVEDVCQIYAAAIEYARKNTFTFEQFDVGSGQMYSIKEFVTLIKEISASPTVLNFGALPTRKDEIAASFADIGSLRRLIPAFTPRPLREALQTIITYYRGKNA